MGDEGVGVHAARYILAKGLPAGVDCVDGGTGGFQLLEMMQNSKGVILIDAVLDHNPPGTLQRLQPKFSSQYPKTLTAHDIGLKDLLDAFYLLGDVPEVTLFAVSIATLQGLDINLSPEIEAVLPKIAAAVLAELD